MTHGIKLVRLSVQDVGVITGRIDLGPFASGVSVISGRNEVGKSTLVEALRSALFERHDAKHQGIKALQTHGTRNAPTVWVDLDIGGELVSVHKRFLEKPLVEVRVAGGGPAYQGPDAEELLLARLDGRRANKKGGTKNDMGLWGLLWVTQDETAHADPGQTLDDNVRGALSDAVGRQVGQMMGGKHGERVRTLVLEHAAQFFTPKTGATTGKYKEAEKRKTEADERVKKIENAVAEVEDLAVQYAGLDEQVREAKRKLPGLEEEHKEALAAESRLQQLTLRSSDANKRLVEAEAELEATQKDIDARALLIKEATKLGSDIKKNDEVIAEMTKTLERLTDAATNARASAESAKKAAHDARSALDAETTRLDQIRRHKEASRLAEELEKAELAASDLDKAVARQATEAIDESAFEQLEKLASKAADLRARFNAEGTRIVVYTQDSEPVVRSVGAHSTIEVPGLGVLEVQPARAGLAQAVADEGKKHAKLDEALLGAGVSDVQAAKEQHAARAEAETESEDLAEQMKKLAPKGLEALAQKLATHQADRVRLEAALDDAVKADSEREESLRKLTTNRVDETAIDGLREKEQSVTLLRATHDAMGTQVEIIALADLRIRTAGASASDTLAAGKSVALTLTQATTVVLEDVVELKFELRGEDLAKSRAKLDRAERELSASLEALGLTSMTAARKAARAWADLDAARKRADERLDEVAPQGIEQLRREADKMRERARTAEESLGEARKAYARHAEVEAALARNRITKEVLTRLKKLERELVASQAEVAKLRTHVRAVSGPVSEGLEREWTAFETVRPAAVAGIVWEIVPGELGGHEFDVEGLEQRFREELKRAGVTDLAAARGRFKAGLTLAAQIAELRKLLRVLAPGGIDALRARGAALVEAQARGAEQADASDERTVDLTVLQGAVDKHREHLRAAETNAETTSDTADQAEQERGEHSGSLREAVAARNEKATRCDLVNEKLDALREVKADATLAQGGADAHAAREKARADAQQYALDLDAATPQLLRGEALRAEGAIASWRKSTEVLHDKALRLKTLLDKAAVEGRFEELEEARAEQSEAIETLARIEREAGAARLLATVVEQAYAESQRIFLAPVLKEAAPYLTKLRPGTEIRMTRDLKLDKVVRRGTEEDFEQLSGGTREQLSVIVRLALARVMARDKRPLPLILDDTMGWTDDGRFLSMVQILRDAASELQIILLTCHPSRFDRFQAEYWVDLDQMRDSRAAFVSAGTAPASR